MDGVYNEQEDFIRRQREEYARLRAEAVARRGGTENTPRDRTMPRGAASARAVTQDGGGVERSVTVQLEPQFAQQFFPRGAQQFSRFNQPRRSSFGEIGEFASEGDALSGEGDAAGDGAVETGQSNQNASGGGRGRGLVVTGAPRPTNPGNGGDDDDDDDDDDDNGGGVVTPGAFSLESPLHNAADVAGAVTFRWSAAANASSYRLEYSLDGFVTTPTVETVSGTSFSLPAGEIEAGATVSWRVVALRGSEQRVAGPFEFTTLRTPGAFALRSPAQGSQGVALPLTFEWDLAERASTYTLLVARDAAFQDVVLTQAGVTEGAFAAAAGMLEEGQTYFWRVVAQNAAGASLASPQSGMFTTLGAPGAFMLVSPANGAANVFVPTALAWTPSPFASEYRVEIATDEAFTNRVFNRAGITQPTLLLTADDIQPGNTYYWRVTASNALDVRGSSQVFSFSTQPLPGAFALQTPGDGAEVGLPVTLRWAESSGAIFYKVELSASPSFANLLVDEFVIPQLTGETALRVPDGVLEIGGTYFWRITATNEVGERAGDPTPRYFRVRSTEVELDMDGDGVVDVRDLYAYHARSTPPDLNLDGATDNADRLTLRDRVRRDEAEDIAQGRGSSN